MLIKEINTEPQTCKLMKPHRGTLILVFGILSLLVCAPLGIAAWVMGSGDLKEMDTGTMDPAGRSSTQAGKICGIIGTVFMALSMLIAAVVLLAFFVFGAAAAVRH
jgi:hypothetical protein